MPQQYYGEIRMFAGNYAPRGWASCDGQILPVAQNAELFSLIGTTYGGDGITTFRLPDLRGRVPVHQGLGTGLTRKLMGQMGGAEYVRLAVDQLPVHDHVTQATNNEATSTTLNGKVLARTQPDSIFYGPETTGADALLSGLVQNAGGNQSHNNMMPTGVVTYIIAMTGDYPPRQ